MVADAVPGLMGVCCCPPTSRSVRSSARLQGSRALWHAGLCGSPDESRWCYLLGNLPICARRRRQLGHIPLAESHGSELRCAHRGRVWGDAAAHFLRRFRVLCGQSRGCAAVRRSLEDALGHWPDRTPLQERDERALCCFCVCSVRDRLQTCWHLLRRGSQPCAH
eukprot:Amastigsp_a509982_34.p3 type:complete len:165 gc:universal Amastigsp_a509982_34:121-615(+)